MDTTAGRLPVEDRLRARMNGAARSPGVNEAPCCVYGLITRGLLEALAKDVEEVKTRVNTLLWTAGGMVIIDVALRLGGR